MQEEELKDVYVNEALKSFENVHGIESSKKRQTKINYYFRNYHTGILYYSKNYDFVPL